VEAADWTRTPTFCMARNVDREIGVEASRQTRLCAGRCVLSLAKCPLRPSTAFDAFPCA
jgi:hypothetical protein